MRSRQLNDEALAALVARGDTEALAILYDHYAPAVLGISLKIIGDRQAAEAVLQETFWKVWQAADSYRSQGGSFPSWLFRIARNLAIEAYRRQNIRPQIIAETKAAEPALECTPDARIETSQQAQKIVSSLPPAQRQVIEMAYFYRMTRQEIAEATGEALDTIQARARLGLQKLRKELEGKLEFDG